MKAQGILTAVAAALTISTAQANPIALPMEIHANLTHEQVVVRIEGDQAEVNGLYTFSNRQKEHTGLTIYLPVYAKEGTPVEEMMPSIRVDEMELKVFFVKKAWENNMDIQNFGKLPQLEGQRVYWFMVPYVAQQPGQKELTLQIRYKQKLSSNKFIYTPLLPDGKKGKDYGSITVAADRPLTLIDSKKHDFVKEDGKFVVEPFHKRGIVVEVAKEKPKLP